MEGQRHAVSVCTIALQWEQAFVRKVRNAGLEVANECKCFVAESDLIVVSLVIVPALIIVVNLNGPNGNNKVGVIILFYCVNSKVIG